MPLLEAFPDETQMMKYKLVSLNRGTSVMPILQLGTSDISIANGGPFTITPATINYLNSNGPESSGYQFTISDVRVFGSFTGTGLEDTAGAQALAVSNEQSVITNGTATSQTVIGYSCQVVGTSVPTLFSTTSTLYATLTVIGLDSGARAQIPVFIRNKSIVTQTASSLS